MNKEIFDEEGFKRLYGIAAQVLDVLATNKCSVAEIEQILDAVSTKAKRSATLQSADFLGDFTRSNAWEFYDRPLHLRRLRYIQETQRQKQDDS